MDNNGREIYKEREEQKQQDIFKMETVEETAYKTGFKKEAKPADSSDDQGSENFAKISSIPQPAVDKNEGVLRYFKKN